MDLNFLGGSDFSSAMHSVDGRMLYEKTLEPMSLPLPSRLFLESLRASELSSAFLALNHIKSLSKIEKLTPKSTTSGITSKPALSEAFDKGEPHNSESSFDHYFNVATEVSVLSQTPSDCGPYGQGLLGSKDKHSKASSRSLEINSQQDTPTDSDCDTELSSHLKAQRRLEENSAFSMMAFANALQAHTFKLSCDFLLDAGFDPHPHKNSLLEYCLLRSIESETASLKGPVEWLMNLGATVLPSRRLAWFSLEKYYGSLFSQNQSRVDQDALEHLLTTDLPEVRETPRL